MYKGKGIVNAVSVKVKSSNHKHLTAALMEMHGSPGLRKTALSSIRDVLEEIFL